MIDIDKKWFAVSLRLTGDGFNPKTVESALGLSPQIVGLKGEPRVGKQGRLYAPYEMNHWSYAVDAPSETCFDEQIQLLFQLIGPRREVLKALCELPDVCGELFCGFSSANGQGGDIIHASTLILLTEAGLDLSLDLYPPQGD